MNFTQTANHFMACVYLEITFILLIFDYYYILQHSGSTDFLHLHRCCDNSYVYLSSKSFLVFVERKMTNCQTFSLKSFEIYTDQIA